MKIHLIGVGGIGVSALARYFLSRGSQVSGSNLANAPENTPLLKELRAEGIKIKIGYNKRNIPLKTDLVVHTQAESSNNPELAEAKRRRIKTLTYPQALGQLTKNFTTIALAGTHGKSTTTALTALALVEAGLDPTVIIGTKVPKFKNKNFRSGKSEYLVVEADEYKDAFLNYYPYAALITNIDREHLDYFRDLNQIKRSFRKFIDNLDSDGVLVLNKDNAPLLSLRSMLRSKLRSRRVIWYSLKEKKLAQKIKKHLKISGEHNLSNALGVFKLGRALGIKEKDILKAFSKYKGAYRRMEYKGDMIVASSKKQVVRRKRKNKPILHTTYYKLPVYDDYAHHPTEIRATLIAFREKFPKAKIICIFQPHQAERLKKLFKEFVAAFDEADILVLLDVFKVAGREYRSKISSQALAEAIKRRKRPQEIIYLPHLNKLKSLLKSQITSTKPQTIIVMMGAGNIVELTPRLVASSK